MFIKTLTAGVLSASLALTSLTPNSASAGISDEDAFAGIIALLFLGAAVHQRRSNDDRTVAPTPEPARPQHPNRVRGWHVLPADCIRNVTRQNGNTIRIFGQRCLTNNYDHMNRLPEACHVRVRNENGQRRQGYRVRCMRNEGFRTNQR